MFLKILSQYALLFYAAVHAYAHLEFQSGVKFLKKWDVCRSGAQNMMILSPF